MNDFINKHPYLFAFIVLPAIVAVPVMIFGNPANVNPPPPPPPPQPFDLDSIPVLGAGDMAGLEPAGYGNGNGYEG